MTPRRVAAALASVAVLGSITVSALALSSSDSTRIVTGLNRGGLAAKGNRDLGAVPDTTGAIGPRHYLEAVNTRIAFFGRRSLKLVTARNAYDFWGFARTAGSIEDPYVVWDYGAQRWYYTSLFTGASGNRVLFAWTKAGDRPNLSTAWCRTSISSGTFIDDFPHLGFSRNWIVISTNVATRDHELVSARVIVLAKPAGESCKRPAVKSFGNKAKPLHRADGHLAITLIPVSPVRPSGRAYVVSSDCVYDPEPGKEYDPCGTRKRRQANQITVWRVEGPRRSPRLAREGGIDVPRYRLPSAAPQRGVNARLDTSDTRLYQAVLAPDPTRHVGEAIWTQHTVAGRGGRSEVRWYELDPLRLGVVRRGTIRSATSWLFSAAIAPTARGDRAVIHYVASGPRRLPELLARSRGPTTPSGSMSHEVMLARSISPYRCGLGGGEACPWGDYATATPDIWHPGRVWGSNEIMGPARQQGPVGTHWLTRNFAIDPR
jgi:hypothetical protein